MDLSTRDGRKEQGQRIQQAAEAAGLSLEALARTIGCSRALIYQYVSGATLAQPDKVQRLAAATGLPLGHFYQALDQQPEAAAAPAAAELAGQRATGAARDIAALSVGPVAPAIPSTIDEQRLRTSLSSLQELAHAYQCGPDLANHLAVCQRIIPLARELSDTTAEAEALLSIGSAQLTLGEHAAAALPLREALTAFERAGKPDRALACRQTLGAALTAGGDVAGARAQFVAVAQSADWSNRWKGVLSLGALEEWRGSFREALGSLDEAEAVIQAGAEPQAVQTATAYLIANRVNVFLGCGDYKSALPLAKQAFADAEASGNADQYIESQLNIGVCLTALGEWLEAIEWLRRAEQVARLVGDAQREIAARSCLAEALTEAGRYPEAKECAREAVTAALSSNATRCLILAHRALGTVYLRTETVDEALYHLRQAADQAASVQMAGAKVLCEVRIAEAELLGGGLGTAAALASQARESAAQLGAEQTEAEALLVTAQCRLATGDHGAALEAAQSAVRTAAVLGLPELERGAHHTWARAAAAAGDEATAAKQWNAALARLDALRKQFADSAEADTTLEDDRRAAVYKEYARMLLRLGRADEAEQLMARADWPPLQEFLRAAKSEPEDPAHLPSGLAGR